MAYRKISNSPTYTSKCQQNLGYESQDLASLNCFDLLSPDPQRFNDEGMAGLDDRSRPRYARILGITAWKQGSGQS